eukprot:5997497-Prymnesium_polylepis.1
MHPSSPHAHAIFTWCVVSLQDQLAAAGQARGSRLRGRVLEAGGGMSDRPRYVAEQCPPRVGAAQLVWIRLCGSARVAWISLCADRLVWIGSRVRLGRVARIGSHGSLGSHTRAHGPARTTRPALFPC